MKITFIGGGNMARALIGGILAGCRSGAADSATAARAPSIHVVDPNETQRHELERDFGVSTAAAADSTLAQSDAVVLAVKPQVLPEVAATLAPLIGEALVISIAAGLRARDLSRWLGGTRRIVRAMPNTPALIGRGITGVTALEGVNAAGRQLSETLLAAVGAVVWVDQEEQIDAVTAVSGSGPAYVFYFIEALEAAGIELGLAPERARQLALATFGGAAELALGAEEAPALLRERVTSRKGTTAAALDSFEAQGIKEAIARGVTAARDRAIELADELGAA